MRSVRATALLLLALGAIGAGLRGHVQEGNRRYREGDFKGALQAYSQALAADPDSAAARLNLGNALYKLKESKKAAAEYGSAAALAGRERGLPSGLEEDALFNTGNAAFALQRYQEAVELYRKVLLRSPDDADAKRNLEIALRKLKQQQDQQKQNQDQKQKKDQDDQRKQQDQNGGQDQQDQKRNQDKDQQKSPGKQQQQKDQQDSQDRTDQQNRAGKKAPTPEQISQEQVRQLLQDLERQEEAALRDAAQERLRLEGGSPSTRKDW